MKLHDVELDGQTIVIHEKKRARGRRTTRRVPLSPFLIRVHELPLFAMHDYWRFTPRGLRHLLEQGGLLVETVDSWGNRRCIRGNLDRWPAYRRWHSLRNEPDMPVQVWAFARRPA